MRAGNAQFRERETESHSNAFSQLSLAKASPYRAEPPPSLAEPPLRLRGAYGGAFRFLGLCISLLLVCAVYIRQTGQARQINNNQHCICTYFWNNLKEKEVWIMFSLLSESVYLCFLFLYLIVCIDTKSFSGWICAFCCTISML